MSDQSWTVGMYQGNLKPGQIQTQSEASQVEGWYALYMCMHLYTGLPLDFAITETANQTLIVSLFTTHKMQNTHTYTHTSVRPAHTHTHTYIHQYTIPMRLYTNNIMIVFGSEC